MKEVKQEIPQRIKDNSLRYAETAVELYNFPQDVGIAYEKGAISEWEHSKKELQSYGDTIVRLDNQVNELKKDLKSIFEAERTFNNNPMKLLNLINAIKAKVL